MIYGSPGEDLGIAADGAAAGGDRVVGIVEVAVEGLLAGDFGGEAGVGEIEGGPEGVFGRPFVAGAPAIGAHDEDAKGGQGAGGGRRILQPAIEPFDLDVADGLHGVGPEVDAGEADGHVVGPRSDQGMGFAAEAAEFGEGFEIAFDVVVVPAADGEDRDLDAVEFLAGGETFPEGVIGGVVGCLLVHGDGLAGGGAVGGANGEMSGEEAEAGFGGTRQAEIGRKPEEAVAEFEGAAAGVEAVEVVVVAGDDGKDGFEMGVVEFGEAPLDDAEVGTAEHADFAVGPGLGSDPVECVVAVAAFLVERIESALGVVAAANVLDEEGIAVFDEGAVIREEVLTLAVGRADEERGVGAGRGRAKDVGGETDAVAHGNAHL